MRRLAARFKRDEAGLETVEYAVMAGIVVLGAALSAGALAGAVSEAYAVVGGAIAPENGGGPPFTPPGPPPVTPPGQ